MNVCNGAEVCDGQGTCLAGQPLAVEDGNECTQDTCDPVAGVLHTTMNGHACTDACHMASTCNADGVCGAGALDDDNRCTADHCDPVLGIVHASLPRGTTCDDGDVCNGVATCDGFGLCESGVAPPSGTSCSDGNVCNGAETCLGGACSPAEPGPAGTPCNDGNACTELDECDGESACIGIASPSGTSCDDGNPCTGADACAGGACQGAVLTGTPCGDGDACNGVELCVVGRCQTTQAPALDDGDPQTVDVCNPVNGAISHTDCALSDLTVATTLADMVECLYTGPAPLQTGLTETIDPLRAGAVHGNVLNEAGQPLTGATVTLRRRIPVGQNNPTDAPLLVPAGYGSTVTRADGSFDMALNGGAGVLLLEYSRAGYLTAQREVVPESGRFITAPEVVLRAPDAAVTPVEVGAGVAEIQVARGSVVTDGRGTRQVTLFFQPGTVATMTMPDGTNSVVPAGQVHVRATEYTVGAAGPSAMPASLPSSSAYTYAVDLSLDEAVAVGARSVAFDPPVVAYLENFMGFPTGENMPSGSYRPASGLWDVEANGRVIQVTGVSNGVASLDVDDDPGAETDAELSALGIEIEERQRIAQMYGPGQSLWRVPVAHFSAWDWNMGFGPVAGAAFPNVTPNADNPGEDACTQSGSIIGCEARSLGEVLGVVGAPFSLHYQSDRTLGYQVPIHVPATGDTLPNKLISVIVELDVAGQHQSVKKPPEPNTSVDLVWDGKSGLGQPVQGPQTAQVSVGYEFPRGYGGAASFGGTADGGVCGGCLWSSFDGFASGSGMVNTAFSVGIPLEPTIILWQHHRVALHHFNSLYLGLGGLTLDVHHVYDPSSAVLYLGDGRRRSGDSLVTLSTFAGGGNSQADNVPAKSAALVSPQRIIQGPDGSFYVAASTGAFAKILKIDSNQILSTVWIGPAGFSLGGIATGPDGSLYFSGSSANQVYRIPPGSSVPVLFAGSGGASNDPDGVTAILGHLNNPRGIAVGPDGSVYIADSANYQIRRVDVSGKMWRVAGFGYCPGTQTSAECGDGGLARSAGLNQPEDVAVAADGTVYIADRATNRVRAVTPDGLIHRVAGLAQGTNNQNQYGNDILSGVPAKSVKLSYPSAVAIAPDGGLYITDGANGVVRRVDPPLITLDDETSDTNGKIYTVAGTGPTNSFSGGGQLATAAHLPSPKGMVVTNDGVLYFADSTASRIFQVKPAMPGLSLNKTSVSSEDGSQIFVFDEDRRHEKTLDSMTGRVLYAFEYDAAHLLSKITDAEGHETHIFRDAQAHTAAIVGPFGHTTTIHLGADGYASTLEAPDQSMVHLTYKAPGTGLLETLTDPRGQPTTFTYDTHGRLITDTDPANGAKTLSTVLDDPTHRTVTFSTPQGRVTTYKTDVSDPASSIHSVIGPDGLTTTTTVTKLGNSGGSEPAGQVTTTLHDGTTVKLEDGPDPRFGLQAPFAKKITTESGGITQTVTRTRNVTYAPNDITNVSSLIEQRSVNNGAPWTSTYQKLADGTATWTRSTPLGRHGAVTLDANGRVLHIDAPGVAPLVFTYVASGPNKGRVAQVSQADGATTRTATVVYDAEGNLTDATSSLNQISHYVHDDNGRVTSATTADGRQFSFLRDLNGNVTAVLPPGPGGDHHFTFDARNFVSGYIPADVGPGDESTLFSYSPDGQSGPVVLPGGAVVTPVFDAVGRLLEVQSPSGSTMWSYFPSGPSEGKLASVISPDGIAQEIAYQGALVSGVEWLGPVTGSVQYAYDSQFRLMSETVGGLKIDRSWNLDGQLTFAGALQLSYDATTGVFSGTSLGAIHDTVTWNGFGEATSYVVSAPSPIFSRSYQRDSAGRITHATETVSSAPAVEWAYLYDPAGRLSDVSKNGVQVSHYDYDAHGNRTSVSYAGQPTISSTFDAQDRQLTHGGATFAHAITGERLSRTVVGLGATIYTYDTTSQLESVALPNGSVVEYLYDAVGRRVAKKLDGTFVQRFVYGDSAGPAALVDAAGVVQERYVYGTSASASVPDYVVKVSGGQPVTYRLIKDERGSVRLVVNAATAAIVQQIEYDAYGRILSDSSPGFTPFGFGGGLWDADTGLVRFGARDYDPETGRWTTQDPIGLGGGDTNLYAYVGGDPINGVDPSGLAIETENIAMNSALNGGALAWLGFEQFAQGVYNYNNGVLELSNESTFNQGIKDMRTGACQMVAGGLKAIQAGQTAMAVVAVAGVVAGGGPQPPKAWIKRSVYNTLPQRAGAANTKKFGAALTKGIVGPVGQSGIKVLNPTVGDYTHELKIGGSAARLLGKVTDEGYILFDLFLPDGLHH